jgi:hypothetical protein
MARLRKSMEAAWSSVNSRVLRARVLGFRRRAEQQVHVGGNSCPVNGAERPGNHAHIDSLGKGIQHLLVPGFHPQFEHDAPGRLQPIDKGRVGEVAG